MLILQKIYVMRYFLWLLLSVAVLSCKDDEIAGLPDGAVKVLVDGQEYTTTDATANVDKNASQVENDLRVSARYSEGGFTISLEVFSTSPTVAIDAGSFQVQGNFPAAPTGIVFFTLEGVLPHSSLEVPQAVVGSIIITQIDRGAKTVSGSFESLCAKGTEVKTLRGEFSKIPYM